MTLSKFGNKIFICLLILTWISLISCFYFSKIHHKQKFLYSLHQNHEQLPLLQLTLTDSLNSKLRWIDDHEFFLNGKMYDIISKEKNQAGDLVIYCIEDGKELELIHAFHSMISKDWDKNSPYLSQVFPSLQIDQFIHNYNTRIQKNNSELHYCRSVNQVESFWCDITLSNFTPPPNLG